MFNIRIHRILFELCLAREKQRRRKRWTKLKFLCLVFLTLLNVSGTNRVDSLCFVFFFFWELLQTYALCRSGHFEPARPLTNKYYQSIGTAVVKCWETLILLTILVLNWIFWTLPCTGPPEANFQWSGHALVGKVYTMHLIRTICEVTTPSFWVQLQKWLSISEQN